MDQGDLATEGGVVAPSRGRLTPLRAALLVLAAVLGGVALSLLLGSSPAHAADGDGSGPDLGPVGSVTSVATTAVTSAVDRTIPAVQRTVDATEASLVTAVPAAEPLVAPVVTPLVTTVDTALTVVQHLAAPTVDSLLPVAGHLMTATNGSSPVAAVQVVPGAPTGHAAGVLAGTQNGTGSSPLPDPILTSGSAAPAAALGVLFALFALVLLAARRRLDDDALPASPTFDTDTSPA